MAVRQARSEPHARRRAKGRKHGVLVRLDLSTAPQISPCSAQLQRAFVPQSVFFEGRQDRATLGKEDAAALVKEDLMDVPFWPLGRDLWPKNLGTAAGTFPRTARFTYRPSGVRTLPEPKLRLADGSPQAQKPGGDAGLLLCVKPG